MSSPSQLPAQLPGVLAIAGPTASGKSALALRVAEALDAEIVNADALQVYDRLHILTARPSEEETARIPHHLYGYVQPDTAYSTGQWTRDALAAITDIQSRGKRALLVGGTGLYFRSLFHGIAPIPDPGEAARETARDLAPEALLAEARRLDPVATALLQSPDPQRLQRIVSVALGTDKPLSEWWAGTEPLVPDFAAAVVELPRAELYSRIDSRFDHMLDNGAMEEAQALSHLPSDLPALKAIGVRHLLASARGELDIAEAVELSKRDSRRLAKRQMTWFRNQHPLWPRIAPGADAGAFLHTALPPTVSPST